MWRARPRLTICPTTAGAYQTTNEAGTATAGTPNSTGFISKISSTGTALEYSIYLGGTNASDISGIALDGSANAYLTGNTLAADFPTSARAFQIINKAAAITGGPTGFVSKLNGAALAYSTYLGGTTADAGRGIAVDGSGDAYVVGDTASSDFPATPGAFQTVNKANIGSPPLWNAFVTKLNSAGSALVYSTYLGGNTQESGLAIAIDNAGDAYVTGFTDSTDFPVTPYAFQPTYHGCCGFPVYDAFVTEFDPSGSELIFSSYLGGKDPKWGICVDPFTGVSVTSAAGVGPSSFSDRDQREHYGIDRARVAGHRAVQRCAALIRPARRHLHLGADGHDQRLHPGRNDLLHRRRQHSNHQLERRRRSDHGHLQRNAEGDRHGQRLLRKRCGQCGVCYQPGQFFNYRHSGHCGPRSDDGKHIHHHGDAVGRIHRRNQPELLDQSGGCEPPGHMQHPVLYHHHGFLSANRDSYGEHHGGHGIEPTQKVLRGISERHRSGMHSARRHPSAATELVRLSRSSPAACCGRRKPARLRSERWWKRRRRRESRHDSGHLLHDNYRDCRLDYPHGNGLPHRAVALPK
jgi:Beta-propeller repeat